MLNYFYNTFEKEMDMLRRELGVRVGSNVGEIGGGDGEAALSMAGYVGPLGRVYVTELDENIVEFMMHKFRREKISNITALLSEHDDCKLPPLSCDTIFMRAVYHHFIRPGTFLDTVYAALRPNGIIAVIDFSPVFWMNPWTPKGIPKNRGGHGIPKHILVDEMAEAGFTLRQKFDRWSGRRFCYIFYKPDYLTSSYP
jgi:ubiquinone/menaquinone biosynthesis C-methylase UbiE